MLEELSAFVSGPFADVRVPQAPDLEAVLDFCRGPDVPAPGACAHDVPAEAAGAYRERVAVQSTLRASLPTAQLVGYVATAGGEPSPADLRGYALSGLPDYMVPPST